jgi:hypothetical protein
MMSREKGENIFVPPMFGPFIGDMRRFRYGCWASAAASGR